MPFCKQRTQRARWMLQSESAPSLSGPHENPRMLSFQAALQDPPWVTSIGPSSLVQTRLQGEQFMGGNVDGVQGGAGGWKWEAAPEACICSLQTTDVPGGPAKRLFEGPKKEPLIQALSNLSMRDSSSTSWAVLLKRQLFITKKRKGSENKLLMQLRGNRAWDNRKGRLEMGRGGSPARESIPSWAVGIRNRPARAEEAKELWHGIRKILLYFPTLSLSLSKELRYTLQKKEREEVDYFTPSLCFFDSSWCFPSYLHHLLDEWHLNFSFFTKLA